MLYRVQKRDITRVGKVLADAFQCDPLWNKIYEGESDLETMDCTPMIRQVELGESGGVGRYSAE